MHLLLRCIECYEVPSVEYLSYLVCQQGDIIICDSYLFIKDDLFGFGYNYSNKTNGLFPFNKFQIIQSTILISSDLLKWAQLYSMKREIADGVKKPHEFCLSSVGKAVICSICGEYMMGARMEFQICTVCNHTFHFACAKNHSSQYKCYEDLKLPPIIFDDLKIKEHVQFINQWKKEDVIQWLSSINFLRIIDLIDCSNVTGKDLQELMSKGENVINDNCGIFPKIPDRFYRKSLYIALKTLFNEESCSDMEKIRYQYENINLEDNDNDVSISSIEISDKSFLYINAGHELREVTYYEIIVCNHCNIELLGLQKQGLHCIKCRFNFHKVCSSQSNLALCRPDNMDYQYVGQYNVYDLNSNDIYNSTVFGIPLSEQISDKEGVPIFLKCCIKELENRLMYRSTSRPSSPSPSTPNSNTSVVISSMMDIYKQFADNNDLKYLQKLFAHPKYDNKDQLDGLEKLSDVLLAKLIKLFFKELPEPLLTFSLYHSLLNSINNESADICKILNFVIQQLPKSNRATLNYLTRHFENVVQNSVTRKNSTSSISQMSSSRYKTLSNLWSKIFSKTLIWPPHILVSKIPENKSKHQRIIQLLFEYKLSIITFNHNNELNADGQEDSYVDGFQSIHIESGDNNPNLLRSLTRSEMNNLQRNISDKSIRSNNNNNNIANQEWYWANVTKEDMNELLVGLSDGYFMVRDCSDKSLGKYTLTVRKDGENKLIRIIERGGYYDFQEPCKFKSVSDLVQYYSQNSLSEYNEQLDISLLYPLSRTNSDTYCGDGTISRKQSMSSRLGFNPSNLTNQELIEKLRIAMKEYLACHSLVEEDSRNKELFEHSMDNNIKIMKGIEIMYSWCRAHIEHIMNTLQTNPFKEHNQHSLICLNGKLNEWSKVKSEKDEERTRLVDKIEIIKKRLSKNRPNLKPLMRYQEKYSRQLKDRGVPDEIFNQENLEPDALCEKLRDWFQCRSRPTSIDPIRDQTNWYFENLTREESKRKLESSKNGTFLIRKRVTGSDYALDVVVCDQIQHCFIYHLNGLFGFIPGDMTHTSLQDIVTTYNKKSLKRFNDKLDTMLLYPVNLID